MKITDFNNTKDLALKMDHEDPLNFFRKRFYIPQKDGKEVIYFCGNSLGLQPKTVQDFINEELEDWMNLGVEGHFKGKNPWLHYHKLVKHSLAHLAGAVPEEVVAMNHLTANLHFLMVSFYQPSSKKFKILTEAGAFSSDQYVLETQVKFHGFDPEKAIIALVPREGEFTLRTEDILKAIAENADELALVMFGGLQYYTGQLFDMKSIARAGHEAGAFVGFDLAHAIGNVTMQLHDWNVDFAVWCSYKYLNSGPGATGGIFVHEKHADKSNLPRFAGWWGHHEAERFKMEKGFKPMYGADGWQLSNAPVLPMAALRASLKIFDEADVYELRKKSLHLTGYMEYLLQEINGDNKYFTIITPSNPEERGCQLSLLTQNSGRKIFDHLTASGVIADWREPNVVRVAPVPLYNTFEEIFRFTGLLQKALNS